MPLRLAEVIVAIFELYAVAGVIFAAACLPRAVLRMDGRLRDAPIALRLLIFPGVAALWPFFACRWVTGAAEPIERNAHRSAAAAAAAAAVRRSS
jgi:HAMP domain-containing protein